jgi:hypothetical protein
MSKTVRELLTDGGPDGSGPRIPCTAAMYAHILETIMRDYNFASLVEFAHAGLVALDVGFGMGGFTMLLVVLGITVHGCEKDQEPWKVVQRVQLSLGKAFKGSDGVKSQTLTKEDYSRVARAMTVPWTIHQPNLQHLDVRANTFAGPSMSHFIFILLGCENKSVLNALHAFLLMDRLPERGVLIAIEFFTSKQHEWLKKIGLLDEDEGNVVLTADGIPFSFSKLVGGRCKHFLIVRGKEKQQETMQEKTKYMIEEFPPDYPGTHFVAEHEVMESEQEVR